MLMAVSAQQSRRPQRAASAERATAARQPAPTHDAIDQRRRQRAADDAFPGLARADRRRELVPAEGPAGEIGGDIGHPDQGHGAEQQPRTALVQGHHRGPGRHESAASRRRSRPSRCRPAASVGAATTAATSDQPERQPTTAQSRKGGHRLVARQPGTTPGSTPANSMRPAASIVIRPAHSQAASAGDDGRKRRRGQLPAAGTSTTSKPASSASAVMTRALSILRSAADGIVGTRSPTPTATARWCGRSGVRGWR